MRKVATPSGPFPFQLYFDDLGEIEGICLEALKRQSLLSETTLRSLEKTNGAYCADRKTSCWRQSDRTAADGGNFRRTRQLEAFSFPDRS